MLASGGAAKKNRPRAAAWSLVYPENDPGLAGELTRLREFLPVEVPLPVGGRVMPAYRKLLEKINAVPLKDLADLGSTLEDLRKPAEKTKR